MSERNDLPPALNGFDVGTFTHDGKTRTVFRLGSGPAVIVISVVPGITPDVAGFARRVAAEGYTAVMPHLFGDPGRPGSPLYGMRVIVGACVSREFASWALNRTSPVTVWLRALAQQAHAECGGPGVGVVGMCFTGGFALAMMVDKEVLAPVLSQPSLPFAVGKARKRAAGISDDDLAKVTARAAADDICVLGFRFTEDRFVPKERFARLEEALGPNFVGVSIDSSKDNVRKIRRSAHSVLTAEFVDEPGHPTRDALDDVLELFAKRLRA